MTDTLDIAAPSTSTGGLDPAPAQISAMRDQWVSLGLDPASFDQAASGAPPVATGGLEVEPDLQTLSALKTPQVSPDQAKEMVLALQAAGVPQDQIDAALAEDGFGPAAADTRTDEEKEFDAAFPGAKPEEYRVAYMGRIPTGMDATALAEFNQHATTWASEVGFPAEVGAAVVERAMDVGQATSRMSAPERELFKREQAVNFERLAGGPELAAERMALATKALARASRGFTFALYKSGALDDAGVILHLANQGERLAARG